MGARETIGGVQDLELVVVGIDHATAGVELRERVAFDPTEIEAALRQLVADPRVDQAAILSTCNRVELYAAAPPEALVEFLVGYHGLEPHELDGALRVHLGDDAAHHLAAVTAGMQSLVLGEAQIQGQVRTALDLALAAGTAGPELRRLFESAIAAGRRVRSQTALGRGVASVPQASVEFVRRRLGTLQGSTVLLIGVGVTGELAAKHLVKHGVGELLVLGRDATRASRVAERYGGRAITSEGLDDALHRADVVISSTSAPHLILHAGQLEHAGELLLVDLAVPRDIDPAAADLPGVELFTVDDVRPDVEHALALRHAELPGAAEVVRAEVARFTGWLARRAHHHRGGARSPALALAST